MSSERYIVRPAVEADYPSIVTLLSQFHSNSTLGESVAGKDQWDVLLRHPGTTVFAAVWHRSIVGSLTLHVLPNMTRNGRPYALIENVITDRAHRGKGVGRMVMEQAIERATLADAYKVMLLTGKHRTDGGAMAFYKKLGFSDDKKFGMYLALGEPITPYE